MAILVSAGAGYIGSSTCVELLNAGYDIVVARRDGDIAECWADPGKAKEELGWQAGYGIEDMCAHSWNWQRKNPDGYR